MVAALQTEGPICTRVILTRLRGEKEVRKKVAPGFALLVRGSA